MGTKDIMPLCGQLMENCELAKENKRLKRVIDIYWIYLSHDGREKANVALTEGE